jgi:RNA:NAD 2'-phosphotransferase (TPT1/KptA family)
MRKREEIKREEEESVHLSANAAGTKQAHKRREVEIFILCGDVGG